VTSRRAVAEWGGVFGDAVAVPDVSFGFLCFEWRTLRLP
jgi:hypothetical protein